ncbi:uncharacterized protein LOC129906997 [Episyrphus balteatus]|uniref:uncharacterized protein LOC129906997 n=1 Tax=Episyrphus balteatus TaxID=286459 RepID=UPI00248572C8|nr:uncharacterized protein LOC129906997 [Episyrphus balteatus]
MGVTFSNLLVVGDLNARVGTAGGFENEMRDLERQSKDGIKNGKGNQILDLCNSIGLRILNGTSEGDELGEYTFVGKMGSSVIDYGLAGGRWNDVITDFEVEQVPFSDHMPIVISLNIGTSENEESVNLNLIPKLHWKDSKATSYKNQLDICLREQESSDLGSIENCIKEAAAVHSNFRRMGVFKEPWFDSECMKARKLSYVWLNRYRRDNEAYAKQSYLSQNRKFKTLCKKKKIAHFENLAKSLAICNTGDFWKTAKKINGKVYVINRNLSCDTLRMHYCDLLNQSSTNTEMIQYAQPAFYNELLDGEVLKDEVYAAMNGLKDGKAAGSDGIPAEFYKYGTDELASKLTVIFNRIMNHGMIPQEFKKALIFPIHKKGSTMDPTNYRGISFLNASYKIFTSILQVRLRSWIESNKLLKEFQAGFRPGYSTIDNIFVLHSIVDFFLAQNKKLYVFFIDFKAAFDTIDRNALMYKLYRSGMSFKFGRVLQNLYRETIAAVWDGKKISQWFETKSGVKQGCMLSPSIFALFIDDITDGLPGGVEYAGSLIKALLFADDIVLFACSPESLQLMINKLNDYCKTWKLVINLEKSKVMVFRKGGGRASGRERWTYNNERIEVKNEVRLIGPKDLAWSDGRRPDLGMNLTVTSFQLVGS